MITVLVYNKKTGETRTGGQELLDSWTRDPDTLIWVDLHGNTENFDKTVMQEKFGLHPLAIQDALRDRHPPKIEAFDEYTFILLKGLSEFTEDFEFSTIQLAIFIGKDYLVTRHSGPSPSVKRLHDEVLDANTLLATGPDAVALRLFRILVGRYLKILLDLEPRLEVLEDAIIQKPHDSILAELIGHKTDLKKFRRIFLYHEQIFAELKRDQYPAIRSQREHEINDVYEQQERAVSLTNLYYEMASDLVDGYISVASHRLNQIMKVLTIVTAIFVPLSFLAGIYGMNFENMPELHSRSGYFILLGVMATMAFILLTIFKRKKWL